MAVVPLAMTVPATGAPPAVRTSVKLLIFSEELFIASEKVTDIDEFTATSGRRIGWGCIGHRRRRRVGGRA